MSNKRKKTIDISDKVTTEFNTSLLNARVCPTRNNISFGFKNDVWLNYINTWATPEKCRTHVTDDQMRSFGKQINYMHLFKNDECTADMILSLLNGVVSTAEVIYRHMWQKSDWEGRRIVVSNLLQTTNPIFARRDWGKSRKLSNVRSSKRVALYYKYVEVNVQQPTC